MMSVASQKIQSLRCWFQSRQRVKISWSRVWRVMEKFQCCYLVLYYEILDQIQAACWSIVMREKPYVSSPFFGEFPCVHIPKAIKDINVKLKDRNIPHAAIPVNYTSEFQNFFWSYCVFQWSLSVFRQFIPVRMWDKVGPRTDGNKMSNIQIILMAGSEYNLHQPFKRPVISHLPSAGIIRSSPYFTH